jgi:hypothetical protein
VCGHLLGLVRHAEKLHCRVAVRGKVAVGDLVGFPHQLERGVGLIDTPPLVDRHFQAKSTKIREQNGKTLINPRSPMEGLEKARERSGTGTSGPAAAA